MSYLKGVHYDLDVLDLIKHILCGSLKVLEPPLNLGEMANHHLSQVDQLVQDDKLRIRQGWQWWSRWSLGQRILNWCLYLGLGIQSIWPFKLILPFELRLFWSSARLLHVITLRVLNILHMPQGMLVKRCVLRVLEWWVIIDITSCFFDDMALVHAI